MNFLPYKYIGKFHFGENTIKVLNELDITKNEKSKLSKFIIQNDDIGYRFDEGKFTQLYIDLDNYIGDIFLSDVNISKTEGINMIIATERKIERKAHFVFPEIGLSIEKNKKELYFFDKSLLKFWEMINRPITSW